MSSTAGLYLLTVLIWGTTWMALKLQLGVVPIAWSIAWRFALAALVLLGWLAWAERRAAPQGGRLDCASSGCRRVRPGRCCWPRACACSA